MATGLAWAANTTYALNEIVTNSGQTYICQTPHTSGSTFSAEASDWLAIGAPNGTYVGILDYPGPPTSGTYQANAVVIDSEGVTWNSAAGGSPGNWQIGSLPIGYQYTWSGTPETENSTLVDLTSNQSATGYLFHLHSGASFGSVGDSNSAMFAFGLGDGGATAGTGLLLSQKGTSSGDMILMSNNVFQGVSGGTTGHMIHGEHATYGTGVPFMLLESVNATGVSSPLLQLTANGTPGSGQVIFSIASSAIPVGTFGHNLLSVYSDSTGLIDVQGPTLRVNGGQFIISAADTTEAAIGNVGSIRESVTASTPQTAWHAYSGSSGLFYSTRIIPSSTSTLIQVSKNAGAIGSEAWLTAITLQGNGGNASAHLGFFGASAVAQPTAGHITSGYATGTSTAVTIDGEFTGGTGSSAYTIADVVLALKNLGLIAI